MPLSRKRPAFTEEEDLGLRQALHDDVVKEEKFHHYPAVRQIPTIGKVSSGSTLRLDTNLAQSLQTTENAKRSQESLISKPKKPKTHKDIIYEEYCIPFKYKLFATGSLWFLLFGFVLFSGTFTTIKLNTAEEVLISKFDNIPMFVLGTLFCGASSCALFYLSWRWKNNSIWLVERILLPGFINSATGLGNTLISVGTIHHWEVSATAKSTIIITTIYLGVFAFPLIWYGLSLWRMEEDQKKSNELPQ